MPRDYKVRSNKRYAPYGSSSRRRIKRARRARPFAPIPAMVPLMMSRDSSGFPDQLKIKLKYSELLVLTSLVGAVTSNAFRMNSIFDPNQTGTGHQPYAFDQWAAMYSKYCVLGSKLTATFTQSGNTGGPWDVGVIGDGDASIASLPSTNRETADSDTKVLAVSTGSNNVIKCSTTYSPWKRLGLAYTDDTVQGATTSNPTQPWYGVVWCADMVGPASSNVFCKVDMEFTVLFTRPINNAGS